ncbi:hydroxymethylbilane synthase [Linderina pennispora]|uniref:Porphobilinogen deaminase n=1 Tax=Linderina pennispora TaxID=61395 RepID=A0A1Y1WEC4_9FUNG|nr:hydroxymethylbilane synthase [Linderina pennispora]ORX71867.1 hydroxymethylbilane synthase [Linderina pennispora]
MPTTTDIQPVLRVGSRDSKLALVQTEHVIDLIKASHAGVTTELETMKTIGDKILDVAMNKIGDKGLFTKELELALDAKAIDVVVHSLKDMPTALPENMQLVAITEREDPRDALIMSQKNRGKVLKDLAPGSVIGTGSVRRVAQLRRLYPHLEFKDVRGNLNTRLAKLDAEDSPYEALILAVAGIKRLGFSDRISQPLDELLHAVGQGALGIEIRADDTQTLEYVKCLNHRPTRLACLAERELMRALEGGCSVPIGVRTTWSQDRLLLKAIVASPDGKKAVEAEQTASVLGGSDEEEDARAVKLGRELSVAMREKGAGEILDAIEH